MPEGRMILPAGSASDASTGRTRGCGWTTTLAVSGLLLPLAGCVSETRPLPTIDDPAGISRVEVEVYDPAGTEVDRAVVGPEPVLVGRSSGRPWNLAPAEAAVGQDGAAKDGGGQAAAPAGAGEPPAGQDEAGPDPAEQDPIQEEGGRQDQEPVPIEDLYARFGSRIVVHPDGRVSKTYWLNADTGAVFEQLLALSSAQKATATGQGYKFGQKKDDTVPSVLDTLLEGYEYVIQRVEAFDTFTTRQMGASTFNGQMPRPGDPVKNDLLLVTSSPDGLEAFEAAMDLFYKSIPQILIEARVVQVSYDDTLDIGVQPINATTPTVRTLNDGNFVRSILSSFPNSSGSLAAPTLSEGLLTLGGIQDNIEVNAVLELLQQRAKADIVSHPRIAVRNGGMAAIVTQRDIPYPQAQIIGNNTKTNIQFLKAGVSMEIHPTVSPGDTVLLQIEADIKEVTGFVETDPIPTPVVATRRSTTSVLVPKGKTTIIGGLKTRTRFENESMVPILGDIPILGYLFRSTNIQSSYSEVLFMITPRIIYGFEGVDEEEDLGG